MTYFLNDSKCYLFHILNLYIYVYTICTYVYIHNNAKYITYAYIYVYRLLSFLFSYSFPLVSLVLCHSHIVFIITVLKYILTSGSGNPNHLLCQ